MGDAMRTYEVTSGDHTRYVSAKSRAAAKFDVARDRMEFLSRREYGLAFKGMRVRLCKEPPPSPQEVATALADLWNTRHPIGTVVRYWRGLMEGEPSGTGPTRTAAQVLGDNAVVWIAGCSGCVHLSHVLAEVSP